MPRARTAPEHQLGNTTAPLEVPCLEGPCTAALVPAGETLRDRKKRQTRLAIESAAWRLVAEKGYDDTTVDDIAHAADVAPRTFFRYFDSKEAVLFGSWRLFLDEFCAALRARPADEPIFDALRTVLASHADRLDSDTTDHLERKRITNRSPHFGRYRNEVIMPAWIDGLTAAIGDRLGADPMTDLRPRLFAGMFTVTLETALQTWMATGATRPLLDLVAEAFDEMRRAVRD
jgi:AcrR family transcriptional regulator